MSHDTPTPDAKGPGYETRDVNIRAVLWLGGAVALLTVGAMVGLWQLWAGYERDAKRSDPARSPLFERAYQPPPTRMLNSPPERSAEHTAEDAGKVPPRLQERSDLDLRDFLKHENERLQSYAWIDRERQIVQLPIERAMDLIVERGLPKTPPMPAPTTSATSPTPSASPTAPIRFNR